ncbi:hypothetical protein HMPREF3181_00791 [Parvimonas sp. KA00067]|nr:hypothetical protein HMPREF3181_00791 [Parvimonas sp. KA00067]
MFYRRYKIKKYFTLLLYFFYLTLSYYTTNKYFLQYLFEKNCKFF